jgi:PKD repeat protein
MTVDFAAEPTWGKPPLAVHFTGQVTGTTQDILNWRWDFGDGTTLEGDEPSPTHIYPTHGLYTVTLTATTATETATAAKQDLILVSEALSVHHTGVLMLAILLACAVAMRRHFFKSSSEWRDRE